MIGHIIGIIALIVVVALSAGFIFIRLRYTDKELTDMGVCMKRNTSFYDPP